MRNYTLESAVYLCVDQETLDESDLETLCMPFACVNKIEVNEPLTTVDASHLTNILRKNISKTL